MLRNVRGTYQVKFIMFEDEGTQNLNWFLLFLKSFLFIYVS